MMIMFVTPVVIKCRHSDKVRMMSSLLHEKIQGLMVVRLSGQVPGVPCA